LTHTCSKCGEVKAKTEFHKDSHSSLGHRSDCKVCTAKKGASYRARNPEKVKLSKQKHRLDNIEHYTARDKAYREENKEACNARKRAQRKRRNQQDPLYRFKTTLRDLVKKSMRKKGWSKDTKSEEIIGCSFAQLQAHLIVTAINNYGYWIDCEQYHIDHIRPMASAKTNDEAIALNHWSNFQYLRPIDNLKKGGAF
jgi:hypothetical protein